MAAREAPPVLTIRPASSVPLTGGSGRDQTPDATGDTGAATGFGPAPFRWTWPRWQPPPGNGLVAIAKQGEATLGWGDALLARHGSDLYVWAAVKEEPVRYALDLLDRPGVVAATMASNHADPRKVHTALEVAVWLASHRAASRTGVTSGGGCLTAWSCPALPPGILRVPRLVTLLNGGTATDRVVWELLPAAVLRERLGALPDLTFVESNLDALIELRAMLRVGRVPATPVTARVLDLIEQDGDHDLSVELIVTHVDLFWVLFDAMTTGGRTREYVNATCARAAAGYQADRADADHTPIDSLGNVIRAPGVAGVTHSLPAASALGALPRSLPSHQDGLRRVPHRYDGRATTSARAGSWPSVSSRGRLARQMTLWRGL